MRAGIVMVFLLYCFFVCSALVQTRVLIRNSILRSGPSSKSRLITALRAGTAVTVVSKYPQSGYLKVGIKAGNSGWVLKRNVSETIATQPTEAAPSLRDTEARTGELQIYPRSNLTPGKEDPRVTQDNIAQNICRKGWTATSVRPPTSVTNKIKRETMKAYGFTDTARNYELDHLISLQNGGCPDCVENLFPEAYGDRDHPMTQNERAQWNKENPGSKEILPGALEKDLVLK